MNAEKLMSFLISPDHTVVEAMQKIDSNARGILFAADESRKLLGVVTDGRGHRLGHPDTVHGSGDDATGVARPLAAGVEAPEG